MEELTSVILILGVVFGSVVSGIYYKKSLNPVKKAQKRNEMSLFDNLTDYREVEKSTITDILKQKDTQIKSLNARIIKLEPIDEELDDQNIKNNKKGVSFEELQALVQAQYPKYAMFMPLLKKQIMETTKGMDMEQILTYVKEFTGNKQPSENINPESSTYNPNWA